MSESIYKDYGTGDVSGQSIFDSSTGLYQYDKMTHNPDWARKERNLDVSIQMMTPEEYYRECGTRIFKNTNSDNLKRQRSHDVETLDELKDVVLNHKKKLFMPYIDYANQGQEGLHRMMLAGELFGWNTKFPVLVIHWDDYEKHLEDEKKAREAIYVREVDKAVDEAIEYLYSSDTFVESLEVQIEDEIEKRTALTNTDRYKAVDNLTVELDTHTNEVHISTYLYDRVVDLSEFRISDEEESIEELDDDIIDINNLFFK